MASSARGPALVDEGVQQLTMHTGVQVKIAIDRQAKSATGFDQGLQRAVKESRNVLKFGNAGLDSEDWQGDGFLTLGRARSQAAAQAR